MTTATRRVLVVEDSDVVRTLYIATLSDAGYDVQAAEDGQSALSRLDGRHLDCVVCDLGMPRLDGRSFIGHLRADPRYHHVPVLVVSYDARPDTRNAVRDAGAQGFITKPINSDDLLNAVNRLCS